MILQGTLTRLTKPPEALITAFKNKKPSKPSKAGFIPPRRAIQGKIYTNVLKENQIVLLLQSNSATSDNIAEMKSKLSALPGKMKLLYTVPRILKLILESNSEIAPDQLREIKSVICGPMVLAYSNEERLKELIPALNVILSQKKLLLLGGTIENRFYELESIDNIIRTTPSKLEMHAELISLLESPARQLSATIENAPQILLSLLQAREIEQKKELSE